MNLKNLQIEHPDNELLSVYDIENRLLNEKNIPISKEFINNIFKRMDFDHTVQNLENFQTAMIDSSYLEQNVKNPKIIKLIKNTTPITHAQRQHCMPLQKTSYERLEFRGDSALRHAITIYLFNRFPNMGEGELTTTRSKMENSKALSKLSRKFGLQKYIVIARHIELANGRALYTNLTEDVFESFIGALNMELDDNRTIEFIWRVIEKEVDIAEIIRTRNNYKDQLMQYFHKCDTVKHDLQYIDEEIIVSETKKKYRTTVSDKNTGNKLGIGYGKTKKSSQQRAAKDALIKLGLHGNDIEENEYYDNNISVNTEIVNVRKKIDCYLKS